MWGFFRILNIVIGHFHSYIYCSYVPQTVDTHTLINAHTHTNMQFVRKNYFEKRKHKKCGEISTISKNSTSLDSLCTYTNTHTHMHEVLAVVHRDKRANISDIYVCIYIERIVEFRRRI